jgi:GNAT superfamily N-acetyltransferase
MEAFLPAENLTVRAATVADVATIHRFSVALATYEDQPDAVTVTTETLVRDGFGADPKFGAVIAEQSGRPVGFALYTFNYSTWTGARGMFIEDIWVEPEARRGGVARALIAALARDCTINGFKRIDLHVLYWNHARGFYERLGFVQMKAWLPYRMSGEALTALASSSTP